ncbi:hypothetical protein MASR1M90_14340 [Desulfovibrionales bacterium]
MFLAHVYQKSMRKKRLADWFEKMSVAGMAVGLFQGKYYGIIIGVALLIVSLYLTQKEG